jgi:hypothetical protein
MTNQGNFKSPFAAICDAALGECSKSATILAADYALEHHRIEPNHSSSCEERSDLDGVGW